MKAFQRFLSFVIFVGMLMPFQAARASGLLYVDPVVGNDSNTCGVGAPCATIQAAIGKAVAGDTINVAAGTYNEQLTITKSLQLVGAGIGASIIQAPATLPDSSLPTSAIIKVSGSGVNSEITGFTVTGPGPAACGSIRAGIFVHDGANANIHHNRIQDIRDSVFSGCQNAIAISVGRQAWATSGTATIANNTIIGYQKGGIVVDNVGSNAIITNNIVTGAGTIAITAQNGIQISRGATATLSGNTITGNSYHAGTQWDWGAAGILLYQSGAVTMSGGNIAADNDQNLYIIDSGLVSLGSESFGPSTGPIDSGYNITNYTDNDLDATNVTFPEAIDIGILIWDKLDDPTLGLVTWSAPAGTSIVPVTDTATFCTGETSKVKINLTDVADLYGYQFVVNYDKTKVSATGAFVNSFFDTTGDYAPWNATCSDGTCKFSVSKLAPQMPVTGTGTVAEITFTGTSAGEFDVTVGNGGILSDRDANVIGHAVGGPLHLTVCGIATVSGVVSLQGRATPINAGTVTLTNGAFGPYTTNFDANTGAWSISNVKVLPGGTTYTFDAAHGLYLGNRMTQLLTVGSNTAPNTKLKGGDADNSGLIDVSDITCISGSFGGAPATCGTTGSSDINADNVVNILDLVLPGGNYGLTTPQAW